MRNLSSIAAMLLLLVSGVGCAQHGFGFRNATSEPIKDVQLTYDRQGDTDKRIVINSLQGGGYWRVSPGFNIPRKAEAQWTTADGVRHTEPVDILGSLTHFTTVPGYVYVDFGHSGISVSFSPGLPE